MVARIPVNPAFVPVFPEQPGVTGWRDPVACGSYYHEPVPGNQRRISDGAMHCKSVPLFVGITVLVLVEQLKSVVLAHADNHEWNRRIATDRTSYK